MSQTSHVARNEEKAQSMLYRFREAQAAEMGLSQRTDRRPKIASTCKDLRQCERWRGEILREVSRKVSKIQDAGLTDYEIRDINDQINKLLREKWHWENQIIALGGANYKRAAMATKDTEGKEVPGQRGYKYFGRARELPGVRELFASARKEQSDIESYKSVKVTMFDNAPPSYYGNSAEQGEDGKLLLEEEAKAEQAAWEEALENLEGEVDDVPSLPFPSRSIISLAHLSASSDTIEASGKRKAPPPTSNGEDSKKTKLANGSAAATSSSTAAGSTGAGFESIFTAEMLQPPQLLGAAEMEKAIVAKQKAMLLQEYGVDT
ncbi:hypothetical protein JCM11641_003090 [Rhodosporidiobolus odoratus]